MHSGKLSGPALIIGAAGAMVTMLIHPSGVNLDAEPEILRSAALAARTSHIIALAALPMLLFGYVDFSRRLGLHRASAMAGLTFQALAVVAVTLSASMSGLVSSAIIDSRLDADIDSGQGALLLAYSHMINQAQAGIYLGLASAAIAAWSAGLLAVGRLRGLAVLGLLTAAAQLGILVLNPKGALGIHGFLFAAVASGVWSVALGVALWRDWRGEDGTAA